MILKSIDFLKLITKMILFIIWSLNKKLSLKRETPGMEIQHNIYLAPNASFIVQ